MCWGHDANARKEAGEETPQLSLPRRARCVRCAPVTGLTAGVLPARVEGEGAAGAQSPPGWAPLALAVAARAPGALDVL